MFQSIQSKIQSLLPSILPFAIMMLVFYFLLIRPQNNKRKAMEQMLNNLKIGDKVLTHSGITGTITTINDNTIGLCIAENVNVNMIKNYIAKVEKG